MSDPYIGEIKMWAGDFAPRGYLPCDGRLLSIQSNTALFSILGTTYGGDGRVTFALPNLGGRLPMHWGDGPGLTPRVLGEMAGQDTVTLTAAEMPAHSHQVMASTDAANTTASSGNVMASTAAADPIYRASSASPVNLAPTSVAVSGSSLPHENRMPYQSLTFIICVQGVFPPRS